MPVSGLDAVHWAPDGRHILTTAEFQVDVTFEKMMSSVIISSLQLRITVWSLINTNVSYIKHPKFSDQGETLQAYGHGA